MISLINILEDIRKDFLKEQYKDSVVLTRRFVLEKNNIIIVSLYKNTGLCEIAIEIPEKITIEELNSIPKWKGMEEKCEMLSDKIGSRRRRCLSFEQLRGYDQAIFINVMQDICDALKYVDKEKCVSIVKKTLQKWSIFFQLEKNYVLSANVQQGLYSVNYGFLKK